MTTYIMLLKHMNPVLLEATYDLRQHYLLNCSHILFQLRQSFPIRFQLGGTDLLNKGVSSSYFLVGLVDNNHYFSSCKHTLQEVRRGAPIIWCYPHYCFVLNIPLSLY